MTLGDQKTLVSRMQGQPEKARRGIHALIPQGPWEVQQSPQTWWDVARNLTGPSLEKNLRLSNGQRQAQRVFAWDKLGQSIGEMRMW